MQFYTFQSILQLWNSSITEKGSISIKGLSICDQFFLGQMWNSFIQGGTYMKAKKTVAIGMAALMMSGVFAGCGSGAGNDSDSGNVSLTIFQAKIEANDGYKKLIKEYEEKKTELKVFENVEKLKESRRYSS